MIIICAFVKHFEVFDVAGTNQKAVVIPNLASRSRWGRGKESQKSLFRLSQTFTL